MIKEINCRTEMVGKNIISEMKIYDENKNTELFIVTQIGDLYYGVFEDSYLDFKMGISSKEPKKIAGEDYLWWYENDECEYQNEFEKTLHEAKLLETKLYCNKKYARMKKPLNNIKFEIVEKKERANFCCGPCGSTYEIKFHILEDDTYLFAACDDMFGYSIAKKSLLEESEEVEDCEVIEMYEEFKEAKKSKYYDLFLEVEKYKDGFYDIQQ